MKRLLIFERGMLPVFRAGVFAVLVMGTAQLASSGEGEAHLRDGGVLRGQMRGESARGLTFLANEKPRPLREIHRIECPRSSPGLQNHRPARVFSLRGGGEITAELIRFTEQEITIDFRGRQLSLPRRAVLAISQLQGAQQVLFEEFDSPRLSPAWKKSGEVRIAPLENRSALQVSSGGSLSYSLENPLAAMRWSAAFFDPEPDSQSSTAGLELVFGNKKNSNRATILLKSAEKDYAVLGSAELRLTRQPVRREAGWRRLTVLCDEMRFQVLIDSHLLAAGRPPQSPLTSIRLFSEPAPNSADEAHAVWFDDVLLSEFVPQANNSARISFGKQDRVLLADGDELFGEVRGIGSQGLLLKGIFGEAALSWHQVRRVIFSDEKAEGPLLPKSPLGWSADVRFQSWVDHPSQPGDELSATLLAADANSLRMFHPWLGAFGVSWEEIDAIQPRFLGASQILSPDVRHLGNQIKSAFRHQQPGGTSWVGEFSVEEAASGSAFLSIEAAELEPAGRKTPPGSRYLSELRGGFLGTEVFLNGESLGRLNDLISKRDPIESPQRIRLEISANLLREGRNTWRIEQTPLKDNDSEFDDCELGPIVLEFEYPTSP